MDNCFAAQPSLAVRQTIVEQLDDLLEALDRRHLSIDDVHKVRKGLKHARAALRLLRGSMSKTAFIRDNRTLRDAGRRIRSVRDTEVLVTTARRLLKKPQVKRDDHFRRLLRALQQDHREAQRHPVRAVTLRRGIRAVQRRMQSLPLARIRRVNLQANLRHAYKKARRAFAATCAEANDERLHEWRKQDKYFVQQLEMVCGAKPPWLGERIKKARRIADSLGDDHDLAMLYATIESNSQTSAHGSLSVVATLAKARRERAKLQRASRHLGRRLFASKPRRFAKQLAQHEPCIIGGH